VNGLQPSRDRLVDWLRHAAYPLWSRNGVDAASGGFVEALDQNGAPLASARRARVHPRQVYAFAQALRLGWQGEVSGLIEYGMSYFVSHYRRPDGLFLTLAAADGSVQDGRALLYDQAFALLGYAAAATALGARERWEAAALELRLLIDRHLRTDAGAYRSEAGADGYESNPHMHLFEAYLAWAEISEEPGWTEGIGRLVDLALTHFMRSGDGAVGEYYSATWQSLPGASGSSIEPGHQFEWAWLLLRAAKLLSRPLREPARQLIAIGERYGVREGFAINALREDLSVYDAAARLWPQCERLKATLLAAALTGDQAYWIAAREAANSLCAYLKTPIPGLWFDVRSAAGEMQGNAAPASSLYHLVSAILTLDDATRALP
jgi:mannose/cellobiose epimerase-like protein (N-acyl-D-glucosamine 2-epimerase family)